MDRRRRALGVSVAFVLTFAAGGARPAEPGMATMEWSGFAKFEYRADLSATPWVPDSKGGNEAAYFPDADRNGVVDGRARSAFWVRRARLVARGGITPEVDWSLATNLHQAQNPLGSAEVRWRPAGWVTATAGQFKLPAGTEIMESSHRNPLIDRAVVSERLSQEPAYRDLGVMAEVRHAGVALSAAHVAGHGHNRGEANNRRDWAGRIAFGPLAGASAGAHAYHGWPGVPGADRRRYGADLNWSGAPWLLRGEFVTQRDAPAGGVRWSRGAYALVAMRFGRAQPVARAEWFDPASRTGGDEGYGVTTGLNWYVEGDTRLSFNWVHRRDRTRAGLRDALETQMQIAF